MNSLWTIIAGALVASSCGLLGCFLILRRMAMIGNAISHAILPGIVIAFLLSGPIWVLNHKNTTIPMLIGATIFGLLCTIIIQYLHQTGVQSDAAISITFTALFAVGIILVSLFARQVDLDLDCILYGEIAYVPLNNLIISNINLGPVAIWVIGTSFVINLILISLFYKQFKICSFDPSMAVTLGISTTFFHYLLMIMVSLTTVASFEIVGAILVIAMLIIPAATSYLLTNRLHHMLLYSIIVGIISSIGGYYLAYFLDVSIAGSMTTVSSLIFILALLLSPLHGVITKLLIHKQLKKGLK